MVFGEFFGLARVVSVLRFGFEGEVGVVGGEGDGDSFNSSLVELGGDVAGRASSSEEEMLGKSAEIGGLEEAGGGGLLGRLLILVVSVEGEIRRRKGGKKRERVRNITIHLRHRNATYTFENHCTLVILSCAVLTFLIFLCDSQRF